jgi:hypothetical protein
MYRGAEYGTVPLEEKFRIRKYHKRAELRYVKFLVGILPMVKNRAAILIAMLLALRLNV